MAVREVLVYPDPVLKKEAAEVSEMTDEVKNVIRDLKDTMLASGHSTGIAAPQIGSLLRIVVFDASRNKKCTKNNGLTVMINPEIIEHEGMITFREGCMSVPDFTGNVNRAQRITVNFLDEEMKPCTLNASEFEAVLIQHETDHLDGVLFLDRVISKRTDLFKRKKYV